MNAIVCDKCGKVITDKKKLDETTMLSMSAVYVGEYSKIHLCDDCKDSFVEWLNHKSVM